MPSKITLNWPVIGSIVAALAGVVGSVLTPLYGSGLSAAVQAVLQALSGLLLVIPVHHVATVAATNAKAKYADQLAREAVVWRQEFNAKQPDVHQATLVHQAPAPPPAVAGPAPIVVPGGPA